MIHHKGLLLVLGLSVTACTTAPTRQELDQGQIQQAKQLTNRGNYPAAAQIYQQLAQTAQPTQRGSFQLMAAETMAQSADLNAIRPYLEALKASELSTHQSSRLHLLLARLNLHDTQTQTALDNLHKVSYTHLDAPQRPVYHRLKASALDATEQPLESARELNALSAYLHDPESIEQNHNAIIARLKQVPVDELIRRSPPPPDTFAGWVTLMAIFKQTSADLGQLEIQVSQWRNDFPNHPADQSPAFSGLLHNYQQALLAPAKAAIILPQSGPYASAAKAIRDGLLSAYYAQDSAEKPHLLFFDSQANHPANIVQQAIAQGANVIIGPLDKKNLEKLIEAGNEFEVPILALNQLPDTTQTPNNLYEFSLRPEDEVEQAADSAWFDGHQRAIVLVPNSPFGQRLGQHFINHWTTQGGEIIATQSYDPKQNDYSSAIKRLLRLRKRSGNPSGTPEWQSAIEADFIFLVAHPRQARLIRPQLQFYGSSLPIYATAHIYKRRGSSVRDHDLAGMIFCDIPWLIDETSTPPSRQQPPALYLRLTAFGFDAYSLINRLRVLANNPQARYQGATGTLSIHNHKIQRQLQCAQFKDGSPQSRGLAPMLKLQ